MVIRKYLLITVFSTLLGLYGCSETDDGSLVTLNDFDANISRISADQYPDTSLDEIIPAHQDFSALHYRYAGDLDENYVVAPFEWQQLVTMMATGAEAASLEAIVNEIKINLDAKENISAWDQAVSSLSSASRSIHFWGQSDYLFNEAWLKNLLELFGPELNIADFLTDPYQSELDIKNAINASGFLDYLDIDFTTRIVMAQTSTITAAWSPSLTISQELARFGDAKAQYMMDMVKLEGESGFYQGSDFSASIIPFDDDKLSLMVISPDNFKFESVRSALSAALINEVISGASIVNQSVYIPLSEISRVVTEDDSFGVAADEYFADFSSVNNKGFLFLKNVKQGIHISITVGGLQSESKSIAILNASPDEPPFVFDDGFVANSAFYTGTGQNSGCYYPAQAAPFIFVLFNSESNTILNIGQYVESNGVFIDYEWQESYLSGCGDSPPVEIYKYKGSLQCQFDSGTSLATMQQTLIDAGIEVEFSYEHYDGLSYPTVCDAPDGKINVFTIREHQLDAAKALGFDLLSNLIN